MFVLYILLAYKTEETKLNKTQIQTREALGDLPLAKIGRFRYDLRGLL